MDEAELLKAVRSGSLERLDTALAACIAAGPDGERVLLAALPRVGRDTKPFLVDALGAAEGRDGVAALIPLTEATGPGSTELRSAALAALSRRLGPAATAHLTANLRRRDPQVWETSLEWLAEVGDDTAWDDVLAWFVRRMGRRGGAPRIPDGSFDALIHLTRHCQGDAAEAVARRVALVTAIRRAWPRLDPYLSGLLRTRLPDAVPGGPAADVAVVPLVTPERLPPRHPPAAPGSGEREPGHGG